MFRELTDPDSDLSLPGPGASFWIRGSFRWLVKAFLPENFKVMTSYLSVLAMNGRFSWIELNYVIVAPARETKKKFLGGYCARL